jgi:hypothetical protein
VDKNTRKMTRVVLFLAIDSGDDVSHIVHYVVHFSWKPKELHECNPMDSTTNAPTLDDTLMMLGREAVDCVT